MFLSSTYYKVDMNLSYDKNKIKLFKLRAAISLYLIFMSFLTAILWLVF